MTVDDILNEYKGLLIFQYNVLPKAQATIKLLTNQSLCEGLPLALQTCFNLDTAFGNQLDIIGKIVGVRRKVYGFNPEHTYFNFTDYVLEPASNGFGDYTDDPYPNDLFMDYNDYDQYSMSDFELKTCILLRIITNNIYMSFRRIKESLYNTFNGDIDLESNGFARDLSDATFFNFTDYNGAPDSNGFADYTDSPYPSDLFYDYGDYDVMNITYNVKLIYQSAFEIAKYLNIVPRPMGCSLWINYY